MYKVFVDDEFVMEYNTVKYAKYIVENSFMSYDAWIFRGNKSYCTKTYDTDWNLFLGAKLQEQDAKYKSYLKKKDE